MIKLVAIDMDETFLRQDKTYDVAMFKKILAEMKRQKMILVVASGNSYPKLQSRFDDEDLAYMYLAGDNGNLIVKREHILKVSAIEHCDAERIWHFISAMDDVHIMVNGIEAAYAIGELSERVKAEYLKYNTEIIHLERFADLPAHERVVKFALRSERSLAENKRIVSQLKSRFPMSEVVTSGESWIDIYVKHGGKGSAVHYLQQRYGIKKSETMCFGDSLNDFSMMYEALYSMSMQNADPELTRISRYQIGTNQEQAVQFVLFKMVTTSHLAWLQAYKLPKTRYRLIRKMKQQMESIVQ